MTEVSHGISNIHSSNAHVARGAANRSSIDLSVELEQQLDSEHFSPNLSHFPAPVNGDGGEKRASLDPHVLAHIVTQLRTSLAQVSQERDDLVQQIAEGYSREAEFKDSLALCTERYASLEQEFEAQKRQNQSDKEAISMLRSKVEESRRGLMRLQSERNAESKRMTLDLTNARTPSLSGPRSSHRTSFTPITGSGQGMPSSFRRTSSTSAATEYDPAYAEFVASLPGQTGLVNDGANGSSALNRRRSMFAHRSSNAIDGRSSPSSAELEMLKRELAAVRSELEDTRNELSESNEAREASESCVRALRDFISQCGGGDSKLQLPPLPSDLQVQDIEPEMKPKSTVWGGLKLWKADTAASAASSPSSSTINSAGRKSLDSHRVSSSEHESMSPSTTVPLRNKFGALFARRPSTSSMPHPHQTHNDQPAINGSDASSIEEESEPISPPSENATPPITVQEPVAQGAETPPTRDTFQEEPGESDTPKVVSL